MGPPTPRYPAGWHPDPTARFEFRYYNGETWTADVSASGQRFVDPSGSPQRQRDRRATAAMVLGIISVSIGWMPVLFVAGAVCAVLAITFGAIVLRRRGDPRGFALTGLITGVAGIAVAGLGLVFTIVVNDAVNEFVDPPQATVVVDRCEASDGAITIEGTIDNDGDRSSDYRVIVEVGTRPSTRQRVVIELDDVRPGSPVPFGVTDRSDLGDASSSVSCEVVDVTGPLPLGLDL